MTSSTDVNHVEMRKGCSASFAEFMDKVYRHMSEEARERLPTNDKWKYVVETTRFALTHLEEFAEDIAELVSNRFAEDAVGERFIQDPVRTDGIDVATLFLDADSQLVSVKNAELRRINETQHSLGIIVLGSYQSYQVLTGPNAGKRFFRHSRPLPDEPVYRPGVILGSICATTLRRSDTAASNTGRRDLQVFLCHASEDKEAVRGLSRKLVQSGLSPWLDEEKLLPGQDWNAEIRKAIRASQVVLICLSSRSERRGYVQKEIVQTLDIADEQPEGTIFLIPARLEDCSLPERLRRWQWVDLFKDNGFEKLMTALRITADRYT
jgi:hypothetical protein